MAFCGNTTGLMYNQSWLSSTKKDNPGTIYTYDRNQPRLFEPNGRKCPDF